MLDAGPDRATTYRVLATLLDPAAYVVLKQGQDTTAADIQRFVAEKVVGYKQVRKLTFVDPIPKSVSGKILRRVLRNQTTSRPRKAARPRAP